MSIYAETARFGTGRALTETECVGFFTLIAGSPSLSGCWFVVGSHRGVDRFAHQPQLTATQVLQPPEPP